MWLHPQLSEGFLPSSPSLQQSCYNTLIFTILSSIHSSVNMNSEEQKSKYTKIVARQGNIWDITEECLWKKSLWVALKTFSLSTLPPLSTDIQNLLLT